MKNDFVLLSDEELVEAAQNGSGEAFDVLLCRFGKFISFCMQKTPVKGIPTEELRQECGIALFMAVKKYRQYENTRFATYFGVVLKRTLCNLRRANNAKKGFYTVPAADSFKREYPFCISSDSYSLSTAETAESFLVLNDLLVSEKAVFSETEKRCLFLTAKGYRASEIAAKLCCSDKTVYNSLYRARSKLKKLHTEQ